MKEITVNNFVLTTKRLYLNPVCKLDLYMLHHIFTDELVCRYLFDNVSISLDQTKEFIATSEKNFENKGFGLWMVSSISTYDPIGIAGLWNFFSEPQPQLLYALLPVFYKKGFATEASSRILRYGFEELGYRYLQASCDVPNIASIAVMERLAMKKVKSAVIDEKLLVFYELRK